MLAVAPIVVFVGLALEHVGGSLECGELGSPVVDLDAKLPKSGS